MSNIAAFLRVIREGESSQDDSAYRTIVGGGRFESFADHPRQLVYIKRLDVRSTAAGAYQILSRTWDECKTALGLPDFSPDSQDKAAVFLIKRRGALADVAAGRIEAAIAKCAKEWASLPGSPYGQPVMKLSKALSVYEKFGGALAPVSSEAGPTVSDSFIDTMPAGEAPGWEPPKEPAMAVPAVVAALLPSLINTAPQLIRIFGSGGEVSERNAKAAETVAEIARTVTAQTTTEGAVQVLEKDPEAAARYREEVHAQMGRMLGLLVQAAEADDKSREAALDRNLALSQATGGRWLTLLGGVALIIILASYGITGIVMFGSSFSDETKALVLGQIVILGFGTIIQWLFGSNISNRISQRDDDAARKGKP